MRNVYYSRQTSCYCFIIMADRTTNIIQRLLNRVDDLSRSILSASNESENNGLNEEVNRVFGRSNRTGSSQQSQENNVNASRPTASTSTATHYQRAVAPRYQMPRNLTGQQASIYKVLLWICFALGLDTGMLFQHVSLENI